MKLIYALAFVPFAAFANPLETDFDKVFLDNAEKVIEKDGGRSLQMESKILISQNAKGDYLALDGTPHEAMGCVLRLTLQTRAVGRLCPDSLTPQQTGILDDNIMWIATFYAENNVPARPVTDVQGALDDAISALAKRLENLKCTPVELDRYKEFVGIMTSDETQKRLVASLAVPRLPAMQPCL